MMEKPPHKLGREPYLDFLASAQQAFRPFVPIDLPEFFKGRQRELEILTGELATPGRQVAIYGERGVGKTSLATLAYFFARVSDECTFLVRCDHTSNYETIFGSLLLHSGTKFLPSELETTAERGGSLGGGPASLSRSGTTKTTLRPIDASRSINPAMLLDAFQGRDGLLIIDEYDRVKDAATHTRLAETLKHFSDAASRTKIIVVGVANTLSELVGEHQSITRCLAQIRLERMSPTELAEIIREGEERIGLVFKDTIKRRIVGHSDGYPYYTHLLSKYAAEEAGKVLRTNPEARVVVAETEYRKALRRAIETAEATLQEDYQAAVITVKRKTDMFKHVLWALAYSEDHEVQVHEIARNINFLTGTLPKIESLTNYLGPLTRTDKKGVLTRVRQGYYKFTNPLMRAYVRLILDEHNLIEANGQLVFPWLKAEV